MSSQSSLSATDHLVGTRIGAYYIEALIGVGGMGRVYKAAARNGGRVALKVIKSDLARDETFIRRFRREARIAQAVRHPHVVPVLETGEHEGLPYLAAKFIPGTPLDQTLKREGRLDLPTTLRISTQIAGGLQALSEAGTVHRDVKPGNILLDFAGTAYLTDFGLAKDCEGSVLTVPGQALGSMDYMAPEQIRGEPVTGAADVYALGCVVFECLCGRAPFADRRGTEVLWAHLQEEPPDPCAGRTDVPSGFSTAVKTALRKEPSERPASTVEYARLLSLAAASRSLKRPIELG